MATKLPTIKYKGKVCVVDFRLEELRCGKPIKSIPFVKMKEGKHSKIKADLRGLRFRTWGQEYIRGLDD